jgi:nicotinamide riboside transporter PnuC
MRLSLRFVSTFMLAFLLSYALISWLDLGSIYWIGLLGGLIGIAIAFFAIDRLRRQSGANPDDPRD